MFRLLQHLFKVSQSVVWFNTDNIEGRQTQCFHLYFNKTRFSPELKCFCFLNLVGEVFEFTKHFWNFRGEHVGSSSPDIYIPMSFTPSFKSKSPPELAKLADISISDSP